MNSHIPFSITFTEISRPTFQFHANLTNTIITEPYRQANLPDLDREFGITLAAPFVPTQAGPLPKVG